MATKREISRAARALCRLARGVPKSYSADEIERRRERLAEARKRRWPKKTNIAPCVCGRHVADVVQWNRDVNVSPVFAVRCVCGRESKWLASAEAARADWNCGKKACPKRKGGEA